MNDTTQRGSPRQRFDGRIERRVPTGVPVYLASLDQPRNRERTETENISPHGARLVSKRLWRPGEQPLMTPLTGEVPQPARVVYCHPRANGGFCVGVEFAGRTIKWEGWPVTSQA